MWGYQLRNHPSSLLLVARSFKVLFPACACTLSVSPVPSTLTLVLIPTLSLRCLARLGLLNISLLILASPVPSRFRVLGPGKRFPF